MIDKNLQTTIDDVVADILAALSSAWDDTAACKFCVPGWQGAVLRILRSASHAGLAEARLGAEPGLVPRASGRKEHLGASGLTRTLCPAPPRCRRRGTRAGTELSFP